MRRPAWMHLENRARATRPHAKIMRGIAPTLPTAYNSCLILPFRPAESSDGKYRFPG
jgi:hypothetical protein